MDGAASEIDLLLDRAVEAINRGQHDVAHRLAREVLSTGGNQDAETILASRPHHSGELRRPTIMFCDLVGSTALSTRHEPEVYREVIGRYKSACRKIIEQAYGGQIVSIKGDGLLALFGYPAAHEDDARRAVLAALDIADAMHELSAQTERELGEMVSTRVGLHRGLVYIDHDEGEVYGLAANLAARIHELAEPGTIVVSATVAALLGERFDAVQHEPRKVKGIDAPVVTWEVRGERQTPAFRGHGRKLTARGPQLEALRAAWRARPGAVLLSGETGIGKSYLAGAFAREIAQTGARVFAVQGSAMHVSMPLHPIRVLLEQRCRIGRRVGVDDRLGLLRRHLTAERLDNEVLLPSLAEVLGLDPVAGYDRLESDGRKRRQQVMAAVSDYLLSAVEGEDVLLVVEDAQWLDEATAELLATVIARRPDRLLVVITSRLPAPPPGCAASVLAVEPIGQDAALELIDALDPEGITVPFRAEILARGDGVPLYIEELVRAAVDAALSVDSGSESRSSGPASSVPDVLYQPLLARLDSIPGATEVAGAAAVIGLVFERHLLEELLGGEHGAVLDALIDDGVIERVDDERFGFRHDLLRGVAYDLHPPSARRELHGRVADELERRYADTGVADAPALARHYELAGRPQQAIGWYERSADEARRLGALTETTATLTQAIALIDRLPESSARVSREVGLRLARAFVAVSTEGNASTGAAADYARCLELTLGDCSADDVGRALVPMWGYYATRGDLAHAYEVSAALRTVIADSDEWTTVENDASFAMLDWFSGRFAAARPPLEHSVGASRPRGPDDRSWYLPNDPQTAIETHLGLARFATGDVRGAQLAFAGSAQSAQLLPYPQGPYSQAYNQAYSSWAAMHLGDFDTAATTIAATLSLADTHGFDFWTIAASTQQVATEVYRSWWDGGGDAGRFAGWAAQLGALAGLWRMVGVVLFLPSVLATKALAHLGAGQHEECAATLAEADRLVEQTGAHFCDAEMMRVRALAAGEPDDSLRLLDAATAIAADQGMVPFELRIALDRHGLDPAGGARAIECALAKFADGGLCPLLDRARRLAASNPV
jgi:class 3 adenylate cyclase